MARSGPATQLWLAPCRGEATMLGQVTDSGCGGTGGTGTALLGAELAPAMPKGTEDALTAGSATSLVGEAKLLHLSFG